MNVRFACPNCDYPASLELQPLEWRCPACDYQVQIAAPPSALSQCAICGNRELFIQKDFPQALGMSILVVAILASVYTYWTYEKWLTWVILVGSLVVDVALYFWVGDAIVCYRCHAKYRKVTATETFKPFDLSIGERYRQERIRQEQLKPAGKPPSTPVP